MAKRKRSKRVKKQTTDAASSNGSSITVEDYSDSKYKEYGTYVLEERAIPCMQDGLKPVQRRILWSMFDRGIRPKGNYKKCAAIVGDTMARFHPHGDSSIYDALVHLVNPAPMISSPNGAHPFSPIDPQGNFGAPPRRHHPAAAPRYTEARLSKLGMVHFECADVARMEPNYNGEHQEPVILPSRLPLLLLLGSSGVAVGASTEIPRHGLKQVLATVKYLIKHPEASLKQLVRRMGGPDYGHSLLISDKDDVLEMYREGKGTVRFMCSHHIERGKERHELVVTSFAPGFNVNRFFSLCEDLEDEKKIIAYNNETDAEGPRISILFRDPTVIEERVLPALQSFKAYQWNVLDKDRKSARFMRVDLRSYLHGWLDYRRKIERRMLVLERRRTKEQLARETAKLAAAQNAAVIGRIMGDKKLDYDSKVQAIIRKVRLTWAGKKRTLTVEQVEYLLDQKIRSMDSLNEEKQRKAIKVLVKTLKRIRHDLQNIDGVILGHLERIGKDFKKLIASWTPTQLLYDPPDLELPDGDTAAGFWHSTPKGFIRAYAVLPERRGKWPEGLLVQAHDHLSVIEDSGEVYGVRSVFLAHGRSDFNNVVGLVSGRDEKLLVMDDTGSVGFIEHPPKSSNATAMRMVEGHPLVGAWGVRASDTIYVFGSGSAWAQVAGDEIAAKRPNCKGRKLLPRIRTAPKLLVVPKKGCIIANGQGKVDPEEVTRAMKLFAAGPRNYIVTTRNEKMICNARRAASYAKSDGLLACYVLR